MDNYIGRLLDNRYEILEVIGTGGMAVVYKARCHRLNRLVAIKILKDELSQDAEFRRRFHAESQAVAMLSHTNIVNVYDVSHSDNVDYIVMELIDGITLKQYMQQKGALNWREVLHFSTQIAKALEHAHSRGIIHRDIKPHNIMILKDGSVKVADFGIARVSSAQSTLTREALGSVHYISPEQAKGSKIDYRSDLYSLGVVMYEMLTGRPPYDGESPVSVAIQHINAKAVPPRVINPQIPVGLEYICMHAMTAELDDRYESATEMLCDLDEFRRNPSINFTSAVATPVPHAVVSSTRTAAERAVRNKSVSQAKQPPEQHVKQRKSNSAALVAGIICIALALVLIGYFMYSFFFADFFTKTAEVEVPSFVGKYAEEINNNDYPNFRIQIKEWVPNETVPVGQVISQEPYGGRMAKSGTTIELTVSSGPSTDTMRNLVNSTEQNARTILDNLGLDLNIETVWESSDVISKDAVIRTEPTKDEPLSMGQTVILYVSTGPDITLIPVPELVGMDEENAKEKLDSLNLKYGITRVYADEAEGTVVFQSIKQQEMVKEGTTINLQISKGPKDDEDEKDPDETEKKDESLFSDPTVIMIPLPQGSGTVEVTILLDGELLEQIPMELVTASEKGLPIAPKGVSGIHLIEVYLDDTIDEKYDTSNEPWQSFYYNFDTGEQVEP